MVIRYEIPTNWIRYDLVALVNELTEAKAAILSLTAIPYQRSWAETLQEMELKREVAGTSKIEGADFTDRELDLALEDETPAAMLSRSQKQARSAKAAYVWIARLPPDRPITEELILEVHRRIVTGCDEDHCPPGELRGADHNVIFGRPRHRGAEGGKECTRAFAQLCQAFLGEFREHDPLIQALALHYHLGAMHPFHDGNGRTARALEVLNLRRASLKDDLFIAMSNYYYDEKHSYLQKLSEVRKNNYDLTPFLKFGLMGIAKQCKRLLAEISRQVSKSLFRDVMGQMYNRLQSTKKRALAYRQREILQMLLELDKPITLDELYERLARPYQDLKAPVKAFFRDLNYLLRLKAIKATNHKDAVLVSVRLEWATEITETEFYEEINKLPEAKTHLVISHWD